MRYVHHQQCPCESVSRGLARLRGLDDQEVVDELHDLEAHIRQLQARRALAVAEVVGRIEAVSATVSGAADEVGLMMAISSRSADHLCDTSLELCEREVVWEALRDARIDLPKAQLILRELAEIPDPRREELELVAVGFAEQHTAHQVKRKLLAMTCERDPDEKLRNNALGNRACGSAPADTGWRTSTATCLPNRRRPSRRPLMRSHCPRTAPIRTVRATSAPLPSAAQTPWPDSWTSTPPGTSPLTCSPDARSQRLVTDPLTGTLLDAGTAKYEIPDKLHSRTAA